MLIHMGDWKIREFDVRDAYSLSRHANNPRVARELCDVFPHPYGQADAMRYLDSLRDRDPQTCFAITNHRDEAVGGIGLTLQEDVFRYSAELGYWLGEEYWGRGIATRAIRAMVVHGFQKLGLVRIYARVFERNVASMRVLEKAGFVREGRMQKAVYKNGQVMDALMYAVLREH